MKNGFAKPFLYIAVPSLSTISVVARIRMSPDANARKNMGGSPIFGG